MRRLNLAIIVLLVSAFCIPQFAAAANQKTSPGSFLKYRVDSVKALVDQIQKNPNIGARYARHFGTTPEGLRSYLEKNVRLTTLKKPRTLTVYFISKGGKIKSDRRVLPAGTRVFETLNGEPLLEWRCGNPLTTKLPAIIQESNAKPAPVVASRPAPATKVVEPVETPKPTELAIAPTEPLELPDTGEMETPVVQVAAEAPLEIGSLPTTIPEVPAAITTTPVAPVVPATEPAVEAVVAAPPVTAAPPVVSSGGGGFPWIIPVIIGAGAGLAGGGGGGGGTPAEPVPEPGAIIVLSSAGIATLGMQLRKRNR